ncbi:MAG: serine hydrolase, partial [Novosphingobium sp.]
YFTMLGLRRNGRQDLVEDMVEAFGSLIQRYGHIPNGTRSYYLSRSQPPFFYLGRPAMRPWFVRLLAVAVLAAPITPTYSVAAAGPAAENAETLEAFTQRYGGPGILPGIVVAVGQGRSPTQFHAAGRLDFSRTSRNADPDSLWRIYSMTKPITGMAAMILVDEGKLRLDQPIADFIPAFRTMRVLDEPGSLTSHPATHPITVRNLLTHTAGFGYNIVTKGPLLQEYQRLGLTSAAFNEPYEQDMRGRRPTSLAAFTERLAGLPLIAEPGTRWSYSYSIDVLGRVIEVAGGVPFDRFVKTRILQPLQMNSTYFTVPRGQAGRLATNYIFFTDLPVPLDPGARSVWLQPPTFPYGGAGLVSSARDYDHFLHMLQNEGEFAGVRIMSRATAQLAMSNLLPEGADTTLLSPDPTKVGFGAAGMVYLADVPDGPSAGSYGWSGAAGTDAWVDRKRHIRAVMMINYFGKALPIQAEFRRAVYRAALPN